MGFPGGSDDRQSRIRLQCRRPGVNPWVGKILWRRAWKPTPALLLENSRGRGAWWATVSMGSQRVGHNWVISTAQQSTSINVCMYICIYFRIWISEKHLVMSIGNEFKLWNIWKEYCFSVIQNVSVWLWYRFPFNYTSLCCMIFVIKEFHSYFRAMFTWDIFGCF